MNAETKPTYSKGVLRAAEKMDSGPSYNGDNWEEVKEWRAQIIHNETRQDAQQELLESSILVHGIFTEPTEDMYNSATVTMSLIRLQAAIAKIEEE